MGRNESLYMTSYLLSIKNMRLGSTVLKIQLFENILTVQGHSRSKIVRGNESSHMTSYLLVIVCKWLGNTYCYIVTHIRPFKVNQGQRS